MGGGGVNQGGERGMGWRLKGGGGWAKGSREGET